jgi:hypothetical protein
LDKLFQQEDVNTAELRFTNAPFHAIVAMPNGSHVLSQVSHSSRPTQSHARSATRELSESIGMTTFKLLCIVLGVRACKHNTDIIYKLTLVDLIIRKINSKIYGFSYDLSYILINLQILKNEGRLTSDIPTKFQEDYNVFFIQTAPDASYARPIEDL